MKVCIANSSISRGGLGRFSISLAKALGQHGCEVHGLLTHDRGERVAEFVALLNSCRCLEGYSTFRRYLAAARVIRRMQPDVLVVNYLGTVHFLLPVLRHSRIVSVIHSDQEDFYRIASIQAKRVHAWVAPSPRVKDGFSRYTGGRYDDRVFVIPHGVESNGDIMERSHNSGRPLRLIYVGVLYRHKGVDLIPQIMRRLKTKGIDFSLAILGDGELRQWLENQLEQEVAVGKVRFRGFVNPDEVRAELKNADVLLSPTRVEAFGLVIVEAMAQGVVPVVTCIKGITDTMVADGKTGVLVDKNDLAGFVRGIEFLHSNRTDLLQMANAAIAAARRRFSLTAMGNEYFKLFDRIVNGPQIRRDTVVDRT